MTESFWAIKINDVITILILVATIFAIVWGPIKAVDIARKREDEREEERRKRQIFTVLMRTRRMYMHVDHVAALNVIQVEFAKEPQVIQTYKAYIRNLSEAAPQPGPEFDRFTQSRSDLFFDLLYEIAKVLKVDMDKRDLERLAYLPNGWIDEDGEMRAFRRGMIEVLDGRRPIPIDQFKAPRPSTTSPFPPPPV